MIWRREFMAALLGSMGVTACRVAEGTVDPEPKKFKRVFRRDAAGDYVEIEWEQMCDGDDVVILEVHNGKLGLDRCIVLGEPGSGEGAPIRLRKWWPLLPPRKDQADGA